MGKRMGYVPVTRLDGVSVFRKAAMGTWRTAKDPQVYSIMEMDVTDIIPMMDGYSEKNGVKITFSHVVGKALTYTLQRRPEINGFLRGSRIWLRQDVRLNYLVNVPGEGDQRIKKATLSTCSIPECEKKTIAQIAQELMKRAGAVRRNEDADIRKNMSMWKHIPWWMMKFYLSFASWLIYGLNINLPGIPKDPFGSVMITNVGSLGIGPTWAPLVPYSRVPLLITLCAVTKKAWVVNDRIEIRHILPVCVTYDHRFMDGAQAAQMFTDFSECFRRPAELLFNDGEETGTKD